MSRKHRIKNYTWVNGNLYVEEHIADSLELAKEIARSRGPHSYKIFDEITKEVMFSEILVETGNQVPEYA